MASEEKLRHELERIKKRLAREQQTEKERDVAFAKAKLKKAKSHLDFLSTQTAKMLQASISTAERKQIILQEQIATLQESIRFYNDMLLNRPALVAEAKRNVIERQNKLDTLMGKVPEVPTMDSVASQWEKIKDALHI